jgi:hypothetical protein
MLNQGQSDYPGTTSIQDITRILQKRNDKFVELRYDPANNYAVFVTRKNAAVVTLFCGFEGEVFMQVLRIHQKKHPAKIIVLTEADCIGAEAIESKIFQDLADVV